jgi:aspartyl-tRNA(Asn)/glutamyl-tRNA(Gln) amidotransferase subunit C
VFAPSGAHATPLDATIVADCIDIGMAHFTDADVSRIARLARIALTGEEITATASQLAGVFTLIETMLAVDTTGVEPLTTPLAAIAAFPLRLRDDAVSDVDRREAFQAQAPSIEDGLYLVPKVIE